MPKLSEEDLINILRKEEQAADNNQMMVLDKNRTKSLQYYDREPYDEDTGDGSQIVTSEFADVVESVMPSFMRVFAGQDDVVRFCPTAPGEEQYAKEATFTCRHVLFTQNDGFRLIYWLIKDALMYRLGGLTVDTEERETTKSKAVQGATQEEINVAIALAEKDGGDLEMDLTPDGQEPGEAGVGVADGSGVPTGPAGLQGSNGIAPVQPTFSGTITYTTKKKFTTLDNIAPEDVLFSPLARDQDKASFLGFRKRVTGSDLVGLGMTQEEVEVLTSDRTISPFDAQRQEGSIGDTERNDREDSERPLWVVVAYIKADFEGKGRSTMERVVYSHAGGMVSKIIEQTGKDGLPSWKGDAAIVLASPILMPHSIVGRSLFDQTEDLQRIGSALTRGMLDNLYIHNRPRPVISDQVLIESLLDWVPGTPIRLKAGARPGDGHVNWLQVPSVTADVLTALEYNQTSKENRTGVTRNNQGLDADSLNKTATGMDMQLTAAMQRQELMARTLAETAIKRIYRLIYASYKRAATGPAKLWGGREFTDIDATKWPDAMDVDINVGAGNRAQEMQGLTLIGSAQEKLILQQGGVHGPFVMPENVANLTEKLSEVVGYKTPGMFFQTPDVVKSAPPPVAQKSPEQVKAEAAMEQIQAKGQMEVEKQKAQNEDAMRQAEAQRQLEKEKQDRMGLLEAQKLDQQTSQQAQEKELREEELHLKKLDIFLKERDLGIKDKALEQEKTMAVGQQAHHVSRLVRVMAARSRRKETGRL